jgi:hypothetical protein
MHLAVSNHFDTSSYSRPHIGAELDSGPCAVTAVSPHSGRQNYLAHAVTDPVQHLRSSTTPQHADTALHVPSVSGSADSTHIITTRYTDHLTATSPSTWILHAAQYADTFQYTSVYAKYTPVASMLRTQRGQERGSEPTPDSRTHMHATDCTCI